MNSNSFRFVPAYQLDAFPYIAQDSAHELVQASDAMIRMGMINAISMACQGLIDVKLPPGQVRSVSQRKRAGLNWLAKLKACCAKASA